jgi:hypothetical protein
MAAAATPQPWVQFHSSTYQDGGETPGPHTVWVRIDNHPPSGKTHVYFRTTTGSALGSDSCAHKVNGEWPDYEIVNDRLVVMDHQKFTQVPITVCGENPPASKQTVCVDDDVHVQLYDPIAGTHLGPRTTADVQFLCGVP